MPQRSRSLERLLRLRGLEEEQRKADLESAAARLREIDLEKAQATEEGMCSRERSLAGLGPGFGVAVQAPTKVAGGNLDRLVEEGCWQLATDRRRRAEDERNPQQARVESAQADFFAKRRERMQVETLLEDARARARVARERQAQRLLDDWYQGSLLRRRPQRRED